jgi:hypothetical protein
MQVGQKVYSQASAETPKQESKADDWVQDAEVETDDKDDKWNTTRV